MKKARYQKRFYRNETKAGDLKRLAVSVQESDLLILSDTRIDKRFIEERLKYYRWQITRYISKDRRFLTSLKPIAVELKAPFIVRKMAQAGHMAHVGPMAAVAGGVAYCIGRDLLRKGAHEVIIENGGDIFLKTTRTRKIGIYAGKSRLLNRLSLVVKPDDTPLGVCTSSGRLGHSLSFGAADSVTVISRDCFLADAAATAVANRIRSKKDLRSALAAARSIKKVSGVVVVLKNNLASWGKNLKFSA